MENPALEHIHFGLSPCSLLFLKKSQPSSLISIQVSAVAKCGSGKRLCQMWVLASWCGLGPLMKPLRSGSPVKLPESLCLELWRDGLSEGFVCV